MIDNIIRTIEMYRPVIHDVVAWIDLLVPYLSRQYRNRFRTIRIDQLTEEERLSNTDSIDYVHAFVHRIKHQRIVRYVHAFIPSEKNPNM